MGYTGRTLASSLMSTAMVLTAAKDLQAVKSDQLAECPLQVRLTAHCAALDT